MATTFVLGFNPIWTAFDLVGRPAGGAKLYSWHNLNPTIPFPIYMDAAGSEAWTNPILFDENGQQGPFYFLFDSGNPGDTYFLELFDADNNLIWQVSNYFPSGGSGGSIITVNQSLKNYLGNSVFWRFGQNGATSGVFTNPTDKTVICPGNHAAIYTPDIYYTRTGGSPTDTIRILPFTPAGTTPFTPDNTPEYYLNYVSNGVVGTTIKGIVYPVVSHLKTLEEQLVTFSIWARGNSGLQQLFIQYYQFTGTGSNVPTVTVPVLIQTLDLAPTTGTWQKYNVTFNVPTSAGLVLGNNNNDALYLIVGLSLASATDVDFTNVRLYLGMINPIDFDTYDQIDSIINTPRTGDIRTSFNSFVPFGWVQMDDGTIGNATSGATNRANFDTFYLYKLIWDQTSSSPTTEAYAPIFDNAGVPTTRGASADADFAASKRLQLLFALGRVFAGAGGANAIGKPDGSATVTLSAAQMAAHTHTIGGGGTSLFRVFNSAGGAINSPLVGAQLNDNVIQNTDANTPTGTPVSILQPTTYMNVFIKL